MDNPFGVPAPRTHPVYARLESLHVPFVPRLLAGDLPGNQIAVTSIG
jgi:hypothetical protein